MPGYFDKVSKLFTDPQARFSYLNRKGLYKNMSDEEFLRKAFKLRMGYELDLDDPKTFCEKLQWLKLYDRRPEYTTMVDKYEVKKYVSERIGEKYVIPLLGVWDRFDDIDFDSLPDQFVLKCTHASGGSVVCRSKSGFDVSAARGKIERHLENDYYLNGREWPYKNVKRRIIAEKYIDSLGKPESVEYKLTCFGGVVRLITVCRGIAHDSFDKRTNDNYDRDFNNLDFYAFYKNSKEPLPRPKQMDEIIEICEKLSAGIPQVRVDCYIIDGQVYFGEMTFYTWSGFIEFTPPKWDKIMGSWIQLPEKTV